jgi:hypothetical protein
MIKNKENDSPGTSGTEATSPKKGRRLNSNTTRGRTWGRKIIKSVGRIIMRTENIEMDSFVEIFMAWSFLC